MLCPFSAEYKGKAANTIFGLKQLTGASKLIGGAALVSLGMKSSWWSGASEFRNEVKREFRDCRFDNPYPLRRRILFQLDPLSLLL